MEEQKEIITTIGNSKPISTAIENLIHIIKGQQIMIDNDLAQLYCVETKVLNQAVKRNIQRFPEDFMFRLTKEEYSRSQIVTLNIKRGENIKYLPYAFTENGIAMLSSVLKSETAIEVNIRIMRAFTSMRSFILNNPHIFKRLEVMEHNQLLCRMVLQKLIIKSKKFYTD